MSDGKGCKCAAYSYSECGCGADWTPQEVYDLREKIKRLEAEIAESKQVHGWTRAVELQAQLQKLTKENERLRTFVSTVKQSHLAGSDFPACHSDDAKCMFSPNPIGRQWGGLCPVHLKMADDALKASSPVSKPVPMHDDYNLLNKRLKAKEAHLKIAVSALDKICNTDDGGEFGEDLALEEWMVEVAWQALEQIRGKNADL